MRNLISLRWAGVLGAVLLLAAGWITPSWATPAHHPSNPITTENQQPGSDAWRIGRPGFLIAGDAGGQIKGYASATSVAKSAPITFYVTVSPVQTYTLDVYRLGWYQGLGGRLLQQAGPLPGLHQPACPTIASTGLIACAWTPSYTLTIPAAWTSGIYVAVLTNAQHYQSHIVFVVRDDTRPADLLYQQGVTTYQAYNNYPDDHLTGKSLYTFNSYGAPTIGGDARAVKVSFDRPYSGNGSGLLLNWDIYFVRWLERSGYDVAYATDVDTHADGRRLLAFRALLSVGHDEYWSRAMFDAAVAARDAGVNLGFFGANAVHWQARLEPSADALPNRVLVCYRDATLDPEPNPDLKTVRWRTAPVNRPEQTLIGIQYTSQLTQSFAYSATNTGHWVYNNTGFHDGDTVPGLVSYETDRYDAAYPLPANIGYHILGVSPVVNRYQTADYANAALYEAPSGARVFAAGTISWAWGLDNWGDKNLADPRIQQMTANVLDNFVTVSPATATASPTATAAPGPGTPPPSPDPATPPASTATPSATPAAPSPTPCAAAFGDVPPGSRLYAPVECLVCRGLISGYGDGTFRPGAALTRGQAAKIVANAAGYGEPPTGQTFADIPPLQPFYPWVERLAARAIISGYACGGPAEPCDAQARPYFRAYSLVTRGQLARFTALAAGFTGPATGQTFADVPPGHPLYLWVEQIAQRGLISGYTCGGPDEPCNAGYQPYFRPAAPASRGQTAKIEATAFFAGGWQRAHR